MLNVFIADMLQQIIEIITAVAVATISDITTAIITTAIYVAIFSSPPCCPFSTTDRIASLPIVFPPIMWYTLLVQTVAVAKYKRKIVLCEKHIGVFITKSYISFFTIEYLLTEEESEKLIVKELPLRGYDGRIKGNRVAISQNLTDTQKTCVLAEELGHHYTTVGTILDQSDDGNRKQELKARLWSYDKKIGLHGIINAYEARRTNIDEMADFLDITPEFLRDAIKCYKSKYGLYVTLDNYIIYFEPNLSIAKMIWD